MVTVLFLDVDGVLNIESRSYSTARHSDRLIEPHLVTRLNNILDLHPEMFVVISSSWKGTMDDLLDHLAEAGFRHQDRIIGKTPDFSGVTSDRTIEVNHWLELNEGIWDKAFVLDDKPYRFNKYGIQDLFIHVDPETGLSEKDAEKIRRWSSILPSLDEE